jgi:hypothetical protein
VNPHTGRLTITRSARHEATMEGLLGDLFKSRDTQQKERIAAEQTKLDSIKESFIHHHHQRVADIQDNLNEFATAMTKISNKIKGKRLDPTKFATLVLPEDTVIWSVLSKDAGVHAAVLSAVRNIFGSNGSGDSLKIFYRKTEAYTVWEDLEDRQLTEAGTKATEAGYRPDFISWALASVAHEKAAADAMIHVSEEFVHFIDHEKAALKPDITTQNISDMMKRVSAVKWAVFDALDHVGSEHRFTETIDVAHVISNCYK